MCIRDRFAWDSGEQIDNSIDSIRFRNLKVDMRNGRGSQIDFNYGFDESHLAKHTSDISYGIMQALPEVWRFKIYPLVGAGVSFGKDVLNDDGNIDEGYSFNGTYALIGMYGKMKITENMWINYNPFWLTSISGSNIYKDNAYGSNNSSLFTHEFALNYQFTPRLNIRYFANWNANLNFNDGDHRIELNYQL